MNSTNKESINTQATTSDNNQSSPSSIGALRLPASYGANFGVKKVLMTVPVGRPKKQQFFRAHSDSSMRFDAFIYEDKENGDTYVLNNEAAQVIPQLIRAVTLRLVIDRHNNVSLIPVPLPGEDSKRSSWHDSLASAVDLAETSWIRIVANMHVGAYDVHQAEGNIPDPEWPDASMEKLVEVAFRGKVIQDIDHPVIQTLLGRA
jgi:hypothetical protein